MSLKKKKKKRKIQKNKETKEEHKGVSVSTYEDHFS